MKSRQSVELSRMQALVPRLPATVRESLMHLGYTHSCLASSIDTPSHLAKVRYHVMRSAVVSAWFADCRIAWHLMKRAWSHFRKLCFVQGIVSLDRNQLAIGPAPLHATIAGA